MEKSIENRHFQSNQTCQIHFNVRNLINSIKFASISIKNERNLPFQSPKSLPNPANSQEKRSKSPSTFLPPILNRNLAKLIAKIVRKSTFPMNLNPVKSIPTLKFPQIQSKTKEIFSRNPFQSPKQLPNPANSQEKRLKCLNPSSFRQI